MPGRRILSLGLLVAAVMSSACGGSGGGGGMWLGAGACSITGDSGASSGPSHLATSTLATALPLASVMSHHEVRPLTKVGWAYAIWL